MTIERGTTQEVKITIKGWDLTDCDIYVTFKQGTKTITKKSMDSVVFADNSTKITVTLSQQETLSFQDKKSGLIQVRWVDAAGAAHKTKTAQFEVDELLYEAVLTKEADDNG